MAVIDRHPATLSDNLKKYPGEWVAIRNQSVVDHAPKLEDLRERTAGQHIDRFFRVPPRRRGGGIFL
jgi:hypothetical protein